MTRLSLLAILGLPLGVTGCALMQGPSDYYEGGEAPSVSGVTPDAESGNVGGGTATITGSGFGDDASRIVVQFGDENAEIVSVTDGELVVRVPQGPITGGAVPIRVGTASGYSYAEGAYTYEVGDLYEEQVGYVQVNNFWESCLGGLSDRLDDAYGGLGCNSIAYIGYTGIDGRAEAIDFIWPRLHSENVGFFGGTDQGASEWKIERPGQVSYAAGYESLRTDIGDIVLHNSFFADEDAYCVDIDSTASYRYGGGVEGFAAAATVSDEPLPETDQASSCDEGTREYAADELRFCASPDAEGVADWTYRPDWPVQENFFAASNRNLKPVDITLDASKVGLDGVPLRLPENIVVSATEGFQPIFTDGTSAPDLWSISPGIAGCYDDSANGERLNDVAIRFEWPESEGKLLTSDDDPRILDAKTYVRVTVTTMSLNWFGVTGYPVRATIAVPDDNGAGRDGIASVEIPASVLYQFPTVQLPEGGGGLGGASLLDPNGGNWGYMVITFERVTDYRLRTAEGGDVVFSYATGDFGFFGWTNPTDADGCNNCVDDDNDGWADAEDPDCANGSEETGYGETECNDGRDNDGDRDRDGDDRFCEDAFDDDESNCDDGVDNDSDGQLDAEDADCVAGGNEGDTEPACANGTDDDSDGWADDADLTA